MLSSPREAFAVGLARFVFPLFARVQGLRYKGKIWIFGLPLIQIEKNGQIDLEENVTLNSRNRGYHINLASRVKLYVEQRGVITIGRNSRIHGTCLHAAERISIGRNCLIAGNCNIFDTNGHEISFDCVERRIRTKSSPRPILVEDNVWICANSLILPGVTIGTGSVIAAGSVVVKNIPPMVVAGGNPARVLREAKTG
jgi:acetyltransferase-like isoleucine patch superfamily enzyme